MPPKTVPCLICNLMVPKSQTVARADGNRVCRSHPGVEEMAQRLREDDKHRREKEVMQFHTKKRFARDTSMGYKTPDYDKVMEDARKLREWAYSHCWTCGAEGISLREHFAQCMITMQRLKLRGEFNFLSLPEDMFELMGRPVVLAMLPYDDQHDGKLRHLIMNRKIRDLIHFLRNIHMCIACVDKHGVRDRLDALMPKPTWEQLEAMMPVVMALEPLLDELAEKKENQS